MLHCTCVRCQLPPRPRVRTEADVVGSPSAGSWVSPPEGLQRPTAHCSGAAASGAPRDCRNPLWKYKPRGFSQRLLQVFLRTRECHMPVKSRPLSPNLGSHKPQLPAWVKICPIWLIIAGMDFREAYLTQLLSAPLESQWEIPREEC